MAGCAEGTATPESGSVKFLSLALAVGLAERRAAITRRPGSASYRAKSSKPL